jgi:hypothetical protein
MRQLRGVRVAKVHYFEEGKWIVEKLEAMTTEHQSTGWRQLNGVGK